ncbi:MAG: DUF481 domain-containing protein [Blastocatellia bacterium]
MLRRLVSVIAAFTLCLGMSLTALADQLTLKNGDRVSGQIVKSADGKVTVKTEFMGTVEIAWDAIEKLTSDKAVYLTLKDEQTVVGTISAAGDQYEVQTKETGKVSVAKASIAALRSEAEYNSWKAEIDRLKNPGLLDLWAGSLDVGYSLARGNAEAGTFTLIATAARATSRDKLSFEVTSIRSSARQGRGEDFLPVANAIRGGGRYGVDLNSRFYAFGFGELEFDEFQNLDLRTTLGGGLGLYAIKNDKTSFIIDGGVAYTKEYFSAGIPRNRNRGELLVGGELTHKISERSNFNQRLVFFKNPTGEGAGNRWQFDATLVTGLNKWLAWLITFSDRYLSNPPVITPALKKNDMLLTTGLRFTFAK